MQLSFVKKICKGIALTYIVFSVLLASAFASEFTKLAGSEEGEIRKMLEPGESAVDFEIQTLEEDDYKLSEVMGDKVVFLLFWSIFCQPCQEEIPVIKELYEKVGKDKLVVVAVSLDGDKRIPAIKKFVEKNNLDFLFLVDVFDDETDKFIASDIYGVQGTPAFFIIDKNGTVTHNHTGKSSLEELMKMVTDAAPGS